MFGKLVFFKLLLTLGLIIALIHVVLLAVVVVAHVLLCVPRLRKGMMKRRPFCHST